MRRRVDHLTRLLEDWAAWRLGYELYAGTGDSPVARFRAPHGRPVYHSTPLWFGTILSQLSRLNGRLLSCMTIKQYKALLVLYGMNGDSVPVAIEMKLCTSRQAARRIQHRARRIVSEFLTVPESHYDVCYRQSA